MYYVKNKANNEIHNIDCDKDEDVIRYTPKYINIANDKLSLINSASDSIDKLMEGLDIDTSNDISVEKLKDFKSILTKSVNKFNSYIKQDRLKRKILKRKISKTKISKRKILKLSSNMMLKIITNQILN